MDIVLLIAPAFFAGLLTFFAPCTLPLVPGFLAYLSGTAGTLEHKEDSYHRRRHIIFQALMYVFGFSTIFILFGAAVGWGGSYFVAWRGVLSKIGGGLVIFFALYMLGVWHRLGITTWLDQGWQLPHLTWLKPGKSFSSFLFGATFALTWSPCVGPILGSVLLLVTTTGTVVAGAFLLAVFSMGLGLPFILIAFGVEWFSKYSSKFSTYGNMFGKVAGVFLLIIGILLLTDNFITWLSVADNIFPNFETFLLNYL